LTGHPLGGLSTHLGASGLIGFTPETQSYQRFEGIQAAVFTPKKRDIAHEFGGRSAMGRPFLCAGYSPFPESRMAGERPQTDQEGGKIE